VVLSRLGRVMPFSDRTIELMVITHPHADHVSGLVEVLKRFRVEKVLVSNVAYPTATYGAFLEQLEQSGAEVIVPRLGQRIILDEKVSMDVLFPFVGEFAPTPKDVNDVSTVLRLSMGQSRVLFTGDAGKGIEALLLAAGLPLEAELLKVGHHGSRHSSGEDFVRAVAPRYAVIEVGENSYGHPHEDVLEIFERQDAEILRTDEEGQISFLVYPDRVERDD
jgi:competence protein ComEC